MKIEYDPFVERQFSPTFSGTKIYQEDKIRLLDEANKNLIDNNLLESDSEFCKYLVLPNDTSLEGHFNIKCAVRPITLELYPYIRTDYVQRTPTELPILSRFVQLPPGFKNQYANYIVFVLYSREQLLKEFKDEGEFYFNDSVEWGIVSIMGTIKPYPDPMLPVTIMRNALGIEEGGNGEKLDKNAYAKSVEFWKNNILVK